VTLRHPGFAAPRPAAEPAAKPAATEAPAPAPVAAPKPSSQAAPHAAPAPSSAPPPPAQKPRPAPTPGTPRTPSLAREDSIAAQSKVLAETIVFSFTDRLKSEAIKAGGWLTIADIERLAAEFDRKRAQLETMFRQTFEIYVQARERAAFDHARQYPFDRLLVNTFAELFTPARNDIDGLDRVTRKVLPGFFMAIDRMVPAEKIEGFQARCRLILDRMAQGDERVMDWNALYANPEAQDLLLDGLVVLAPYFEALDKRRGWFLPLVNDNLQPDLEDDWRLTPKGFDTLALLMFAPLRKALVNPIERAKLSMRHGAAECSRLQLMIEKMTRLAGD
jgi:hypothetical protein